MSISALRRAFSLVELLVVIGVIGIVIGLVLPAIGRARGSAREAACLANLHGLAETMHTYTEEHRAYPFAIAGTDLPVTPSDDGPSYISADHWILTYAWSSLFHDIAPWPGHYRSWTCPGSRRDPERPWLKDVPDGDRTAYPSYRLCRGMFARPELWRDGSSADPALLRPVTPADVEFASSKAMMFDGEMAHLPPISDLDARPILFADAHATSRRLSRSRPPVTNPFLGVAEALHDTKDGARGRDY